MNLFEGVHEVRLLRPAIAAAHFDSWESAICAVESEPDYRAAYFTLNPLRTGGPLNPKSCKTARVTARDSDIARRVRLMIDLDPERPAGTNSTDTEKQTARSQAEDVRRFLQGGGGLRLCWVTRATVGTCSIPSTSPTTQHQAIWCAVCLHG